MAPPTSEARGEIPHGPPHVLFGRHGRANDSPGLHRNRNRLLSFGDEFGDEEVLGCRNPGGHAHGNPFAAKRPPYYGRLENLLYAITGFPESGDMERYAANGDRPMGMAAPEIVLADIEYLLGGWSSDNDPHVTIAEERSVHCLYARHVLRGLRENSNMF